MTDYTNATLTKDAPPARLQAPPPPLRIVIPGGEGHLGGILKRHFSANGHSVTTLTRRSRPEPSAIQWDGQKLGDWVDALDGADVLINLAGRSVDCRYNARNRHDILRSRVGSTAVLGDAIARAAKPPRIWLNASTATIYRHSFNRNMDEATGEFGGDEADAPSSWRFSIEVARQWEQAFFSAKTPRTRKVAMRAAMVMSRERGGIFDVLHRQARVGLAGSWGSGRQYMSWIHGTDFARAVEFLIERENLTGAVNLAAPLPLPNSEFLSVLRCACGARLGLRSTEWMLKIGAFVLRTETELLLKSRRVVPGILLENGFEFLFPAWPEAARDLVQKFRAREESK
jgi:uncharacterized protein